MTATSSGAAAELIVRQRLLDRLDELTEKPLTLIRGPVSSGKTTLLRQWSESFERGRLASLQVRDGTAHGLLSDLLAELGDGQSQGGSGASRQVVEGDLVAGLAARLASHGPIWILVDDRDFLLSADQLAMLEELSNLGSGALHLVLASRQLPDTPFGRYAVDDVGWLDADELRLTADELAELVALNGRGEVGPEALSEMLGRVRRTGWRGRVGAPSSRR